MAHGTPNFDSGTIGAASATSKRAPRILVDHSIIRSSQENPGDSWVFPQPTLYFTDLLAVGSGLNPENPRFSWLLHHSRFEFRTRWLVARGSLDLPLLRLLTLVISSSELTFAVYYSYITICHLLVKKDEGHKQIRSPLQGRLVSTLGVA